MKKLLSLISLSLIAVHAIATPHWVVKTPMPTAKAMAAATLLDSCIYVIGGSTSATGVTNSVYAYNVYTDTWSTKASMSYARAELAVATVGGKIYAIGGYDGSWAVATVEEYNPATNTWSTKTSMPTERSQFSWAVVGGKIYAVGGWIGSYTTLEVYDPATDTWTTKASEPFGRIEYGGGAALGGKFYYMGGKDYWNSVAYDTMTIYNPATDSWSTGTSMPHNRYGGAVTVWRGNIYYLGGTDGGTWVPTYENNNYFNPTSGWNSGTHLIYGRSNAAAVTANDHIYLIGGLDSDSNPIVWNHEYVDSEEISYGPGNSVITIDHSHTTSETTTGGDKNPSAVNNISLNGSINIFPNPCQGAFTIKIASDYNETATIQIVDIFGKNLQTAIIPTNTTTGMQLNAPVGIYTIIGITAHGKSINKLVIE